MTGNAPKTADWQPGRTTLAIWNGLAMVLLVLGLILFSVIYAVTNDETGFSLEGAALIVGPLLTVALTFALMAGHEGIHGLVMKRFGASPSYGAMMMGKLVPVFYCTAPGATFSRGEFVVIALAPAVVLTIACVAAIGLVPRGGWLVVPTAIHLGGCIGDFGMSAIVARQAPGTMVEDLKTGTRFHPPPAGRPLPGLPTANLRSGPGHERRLRDCRPRFAVGRG